MLLIEILQERTMQIITPVCGFRVLSLIVFLCTVSSPQVRGVVPSYKCILNVNVKYGEHSPRRVNVSVNAVCRNLQHWVSAKEPKPGEIHAKTTKQRLSPDLQHVKVIPSEAGDTNTSTIQQGKFPPLQIASTKQPAVRTVQKVTKQAASEDQTPDYHTVAERSERDQTECTSIETSAGTGASSTSVETSAGTGASSTSVETSAGTGASSVVSESGKDGKLISRERIGTATYYTGSQLTVRANQIRSKSSERRTISAFLSAGKVGTPPLLKTDPVRATCDIVVTTGRKWFRYNFLTSSWSRYQTRFIVSFVTYDYKHRRLIWAARNNAAVGYFTKLDLEPVHLHIGGRGTSHYFAVDPDLEMIFCIGTITSTAVGNTGDNILYSLSTANESKPHFIRFFNEVPEKTSSLAIDVNSKTLYMVTHEIYDGGYGLKVYISAFNYTGHLLRRIQIEEKDSYGPVYDKQDNSLLFVNKNSLYRLDLKTERASKLPHECPRSTKVVAIADDKIVLIGWLTGLVYDRHWKVQRRLDLERGIVLAALVPEEEN